MLNHIIKFFLENKLIALVLLLLLLLWGLITAPFAWNTGILPRDPVAVDAIPDIGENQQIIYTEWEGRSPQDIEDQISYPLTTALLGIPGIKTIRSNSIFGLSNIYVIFEDDIDYYWSRTRILEKLNSLSADLLPVGVTPSLGPDATALGQVFWYTLEGRNKKGKPNHGWEPQELRSVQDFYVKYALTAVKGVAEVASIGGYVKEYQIDIDPNAMKAHGVSVAQIIKAVKESNLDVGARTIEFNRVEYLIRALGYIKNLEDLKKSVVSVNHNVPVRLSDVAKIYMGPAARRGGLDKEGTEAVGGVVVARYGSNPLEVIRNIKAKIKEISPGLPSKINDNGTVSKVSIIPFYDRSELIYETLGTLEEALSLEILISMMVVLILVFNLRASLLISSLLPIGVLTTFIMMKYVGVDANIVALSGIAIAIGVMVDVGIVFVENIFRHVSASNVQKGEKERLTKHIYQAMAEVAPAAFTALATTVVSFLPVFALENAEGKLFHPLAFTKTFAMLFVLFIALVILPTLAYFVFSIRFNSKKIRQYLNILLIAGGVSFLFFEKYVVAFTLIAYGLHAFFEYLWPKHKKKTFHAIAVGIIAFLIVYLLSVAWMPLGAQNSVFFNVFFVLMFVLIIIGFFSSMIYYYSAILSWALKNKWKFLALPIFFVLFGLLAWQGTDGLLGFTPQSFRETAVWQRLSKTFPGIGKEFMPSLDEGSFLLMPTTMPHSGVEENVEMIRMLDRNVSAIPEVRNVVGKWGRVHSALDPAPISMFENVINYKSEYILDDKGHRMRFKVNDEGDFLLKDGSTYTPHSEDIRNINKEDLIIDKRGKYFRQWRKDIHSPDDIWKEIVRHSNLPGLTTAPKLQPIQTRLVMLQTGMRAPMGIKVFGPDLESIEKTGYEIEKQLKKVEGVAPISVFADRVVGKPYLLIRIDRNAIARYGLTIQDFQRYIGSTVGGMRLTTTVEGRERYDVRVRYARAFRDNPDDMKGILIPTPSGAQVPLGELADIEYTRGPQMIKSENTFLVGYVIFDKQEGYAEVNVVENARHYLDKKIEEGELKIPTGVNYVFTGNYENQIRATNRLMFIIPLSLLIIFLLLYLQFKSTVNTLLIFSGIAVAFSGGFLLLWLYGQDWFMDMSLFGMNLREVFQIQPINLSVAVWVGFLALFGIATDDGVLISAYLKQIFEKKKPHTIADVRSNVIEAGTKRIRPAMMTVATTVIALLPVLTSVGKGADIMIPMAIPAFGGMLLAALSVFIVPVLYSMWQENKIKK